MIFLAEICLHVGHPLPDLPPQAEHPPRGRLHPRRGLHQVWLRVRGEGVQHLAEQGEHGADAIIPVLTR